jgi:hypothetical protein
LAIEEITDMERIDKGQIECRFELVSILSNRPHARVSFSGTVEGLNEDGPNKQQLDGYFLFDLVSNHLSYLWLKGINSMLDKDGRALGSIEGDFVLTRQAHSRAPDLSDGALRGVTLEPNAENTLLLYDNSELGIRFLHPRRWHVAGVRGTQIAVDEANGSGLLLTVETPARTPTGSQFLTETRNYLQQQKARILQSDSPRRVQGLPNQIEQFAFQVEAGGQRVLMEYFVLRQASAGAVITARLLPNDLANVRKEVAAIAGSVQLEAPSKK